MSGRVIASQSYVQWPAVERCSGVPNRPEPSERVVSAHTRLQQPPFEIDAVEATAVEHRVPALAAHVGDAKQ